MGGSSSETYRQFLNGCDPSEHPNPALDSLQSSSRPRSERAGSKQMASSQASVSGMSEFDGNTRSDGQAPILLVRIVRGVTDHFMLRMPDWILSAMLTNFGAILLSPELTFPISHTYDAMARLASETVWGSACLAVGVLRLFFLFINGTFPRFRWSPHVRFFCSMLSCFAWFNVAIGIQMSGLPTTGLAIYRYLLIFDICNCFLAASEAGAAERKFRDGGTGNRSSVLS